MENIRFNEQLIKQLSALEGVEKVTPKMICFTNKFKLYAVNRKRQEGIFAYQIFAEAGVDISLFGKRYFQDLLKSWNQQFTKEGSLAFEPKTKGRPRKTSENVQHMTSDELKAKVAYLEAEVDFLKKLRSLEEL